MGMAEPPFGGRWELKGEMRARMIQWVRERMPLGIGKWLCVNLGCGLRGSLTLSRTGVPTPTMMPALPATLPAVKFIMGTTTFLVRRVAEMARA